MLKLRKAYLHDGPDGEKRASRAEIMRSLLKVLPPIYIAIEIAVLCCTKKSFPVIYLIICAVGFLIPLLKRLDKDGSHASAIAVTRDCYAIFWSSMHAFVIFGVMTNTSKYFYDLTSPAFPQIVDIFIMAALFWIVYMIVGRVPHAVSIANGTAFFLGTINLYLLRFRGYPFNLSDISAIPTAVGIMGQYNFTPDAKLILTFIDFALWSAAFCLIYAYKTDPRAKKIKSARMVPVRWNKCTGIVSCVVAFGCVILPFSVKSNAFGFQSNEYLYRLVAKTINRTTPPKDYSTQQVQHLAGDYEEPEEADSVAESVSESLPNIVVIMNESFADLRVLGDYETDVPVLEFLDSLDENVIRGMTNVSVYGGGTANSEYEFLTSDTMAIYDDVFPYNHFFSIYDEYPGLPLQLKQLGYETSAFHPYFKSGWNRPEVYSSMQFDHMTFLDDIEADENADSDTLRDYVSDAGSYSFIKEWFENKEPGKPQFFFNVTMQNHGGYTYESDEFESTVHITGDGEGLFPQTEQYLTLAKASDEAIADLLSWFEDYSEPVIVVMFGDHQPKVEDEFLAYAKGIPTDEWTVEQQLDKYRTPFFIWHNYDTESSFIGDVSLNYLSAMLMEDAGLPTTDYQKFVLSKYEEYPVITQNAVIDSEGAVFERGTDEYSVCISDYSILAYNHTVDRKNRLEDFFRLEPVESAEDELPEES